MKLLNNDYLILAAAVNDESGFVEYEKDGEVLSFDYTMEVEGYEEDDYFNGTGAWVTTDVILEIENVACCDEEGEEVPFDFDYEKLNKEVNELIS